MLGTKAYNDDLITNHTYTDFLCCSKRLPKEIAYCTKNANPIFFSYNLKKNDMRIIFLPDSGTVNVCMCVSLAAESQLVSLSVYELQPSVHHNVSSDPQIH